MSLFGGGEQSPQQQRLEEVENKLKDDIAIKEWQTVIDHVKSMLGDVRGQIEAVSFCRAYLAELVHLSDEVASEMGIPREVASILAYRVHKMATMSIEDRFNKIASNQGFMESFKEQAKSPTLLTESEVAELEAEKLQLELTVAQQQEECPDCGGDCGCKDAEAESEKFGTLNPKDPFGLN